MENKNLIKILAILSLLLFLISLLIFFVFSKGKETQKTIPTPSPKITHLDFSLLKPGEFEKEDVIKNFGTPLPKSNENTLLYSSQNPNFPHQILLRENKVFLIKEVVTPEDKKTPKDIIEKYGVPKYTLFGPYSTMGFNLYIYPEKGIAFLGHKNFTGLLEVWYFKPTDFETFKKELAPDYSTEFIPKQ